MGSWIFCHPLIFDGPGIHFRLEPFIGKGKLAGFLNFLSPWIGPEPSPPPPFLFGGSKSTLWFLVCRESTFGLNPSLERGSWLGWWIFCHLGLDRNFPRTRRFSLGGQKSTLWFLVCQESTFSLNPSLQRGSWLGSWIFCHLGLKKKNSISIYVYPTHPQEKVAPQGWHPLKKVVGTTPPHLQVVVVEELILRFRIQWISSGFSKNS